VQFKTVCGFTLEELDGLVDLSSAFVKSGTDPQMAPALALLPLGRHTMLAQEASRGKRWAVGKSVKAKQEQCERTER